MNPNTGSNGRQQPHQYQKQDYTQQAYTGQPMVHQQNIAHQMSQSPIQQQFGTPSPAQHEYQKQQPAQQSYQQEIIPTGTPSAPVANSWSQQMQYSQATPTFQGQFATNTATSTTTTTTTTTKKSTKLRDAFRSRKEPSVASNTSTTDYSSLYQPPPPPPPPQQQQQATVDYPQLGQTAPPTPPIPAIDYSKLAQAAPPPPPPAQQKTDFSQLMQATSQPQIQPTQSKSKPKSHYGLDQLRADAAQHASSLSNTQTTTTTSQTETGGSASRVQAASQGAAALRQFDEDVSAQLNSFLGNVCPLGFRFYAVRQGYLCGGGTHFILHEDVEAMLKYGRCPRLEDANMGPHSREVTPPPGNGNGSGGEPLFWTSQQQLYVGLYPFARLKDPRFNPRLNGGRNGIDRRRR